jgi:hypothetical protein
VRRLWPALAWLVLVGPVYLMVLWNCFWASLFAPANDPILQECANRAQIGQFMWLLGAAIIAVLGYFAVKRGLLRGFASRIKSFPLRVVRTKTLRELRDQAASDSDQRYLPPEPPESIKPEPPSPMTLRQRCERFAGEMERAVAERDNLPYQIQGRFGDYKYFLPRLRELRQELVYDGREPPQPLSLSNMMAELSRRDALRMVEALRNVTWGEG